MVLHGAVRAVVVLFIAVVVLRLFGWSSEPRDILTVARPALLIGVLPAVWARRDRSRFGSALSQWVWAWAAAFVSAVLAIAAGVQGAPLAGLVFAALVGGSIVAVPAWAVATGANDLNASSGTPRRSVPRAVTTLVAIGGAAALLAVPIAVGAWQASIEWSGCFLNCHQPDHVAAFGWAVAACALFIDVIVWGVTAWRGFPSVLTRAAAVPLVVVAAGAFLMS